MTKIQITKKGVKKEAMPVTTLPRGHPKDPARLLWDTWGKRAILSHK